MVRWILCVFVCMVFGTPASAQTLGTITGEVKDYHQIHHSKKTISPTGQPIIVDKSGSRKTYYTEEQVLYK